MKNNLINNTTTNDYTIFNQNYMAPFTNITNFLKAVYVVIKLYSKSHNFNIATIQNAILVLTSTSMTLFETKAFTIRVTLHPEIYPINLLSDFDKLRAELIAHTQHNREASIVIESNALFCHGCGFSGANWFIINNPPLTKIATLYTLNGIGK